MTTNANPSIAARMLWLPADAMTRLRGSATLRVVRGMLWLTVDGEPDDHVLSRGDRFTLRRGHKALVQALSARVSVEVVEDAPRFLRDSAVSALEVVRQRFAGVLS